MKISDSLNITIYRLPLDACPCVGFVHFMEMKWTESFFSKRFGDSSNNDRTMTTWIKLQWRRSKKKCFKLNKGIKLRYKVFYLKQKKNPYERKVKSTERLMNILERKFNSILYFHIFHSVISSCYENTVHRTPNDKIFWFFFVSHAMAGALSFSIVELVVWHPLVIVD